MPVVENPGPQHPGPQVHGDVVTNLNSSVSTVNSYNVSIVTWLKYYIVLGYTD